VTLKQLGTALYATYLTNKYALKCKFAPNNAEVRRIRDEYAVILMKHLGIEIIVSNPEKAPTEKAVILCNHRSVIDPLLIDLALVPTPLYGLWIAKKELYNSFFFGLFVRNAGTILLDRESSQMGGFFKDVKESVKNDCSICIFPEGTRNKTDKNLTEFKEGAKIIALKNRLQIIPMHIRTNANEALKQAMSKDKEIVKIYVEYGDAIDPKDKSMSLEENYRKQFDIVD